MSDMLVAAIGSGSLVGFTLGLLGGGGSILATPLLLYVVGVTSPHVAIGTGALAVAVNAAANFLNHAMKGHVRWRCGLIFSVFGVAGAFGGSTLGKSIDGSKLLLLFGLVMIVVGVLMLRKRAVAVDTVVRKDDLATCALTAVVAVATGAASGFFGIGGGFLIVPALMFATGMPMIDAIGTSLMAVTAFGLATAGNYALSGLVDWPLAGEFILGGVIGGVIGTIASTWLCTYKNVLNRIFAGVIFVVAAYVIYRSLGSLGA
jgi:uncharacterized protein